MPAEGTLFIYPPEFTLLLLGPSPPRPLAGHSFDLLHKRCGAYMMRGRMEDCVVKDLRRDDGRVALLHHRAC